MKEKHRFFERGPVSPFEFDEDEPVIRLKLPADSVSGWTMKHLNTEEVNMFVQYLIHEYSYLCMKVIMYQMYSPLLYSTQLYADDIVKMRTYFIPFQVSVKWSEDQGHPLRELEYDMVITGAKTHKLRVESPDQCTKGN